MSIPSMPRPLLITLLAATLLAACGRGDDAAEPAADSRPSLAVDAQATLGDYITESRALVERIDDNAPVEELRERTQSLLDLGLSVLPAYLDVRPECSNYLNAAARIAELWPQLDLDTIEQDFHDDGALPTGPETVVCYNMKDLVVHPATGLAILAQETPELNELRKEIAEVIAHALAVQRRP
jgi:hypothetical protein